MLLVGETRGDEVLGLAGLVDGGDGPVARAGQRPGALHDLVEHGLKIEARADAQQRRGQAGLALLRRLLPASGLILTRQSSILLARYRRCPGATLHE